MAKKQGTRPKTGNPGVDVQELLEKRQRLAESLLQKLLRDEVEDRFAAAYRQLLVGLGGDRQRLIALAIRCAWRVRGLIVQGRGDDPGEVKRSQEVVQEILESAWAVCIFDPKCEDITRKKHIDALEHRLVTIKVDAPQCTPINKAATAAERLTQVVSRCYADDATEYALASACGGLLAAVEAALLIEARPFDQSADAKLVHAEQTSDLAMLSRPWAGVDASVHPLGPCGPLWAKQIPRWAQAYEASCQLGLHRLTTAEKKRHDQGVRRQQEQHPPFEPTLPARQLEALGIDTLRAQMKVAKEVSGLSLRDIGVRMGYAPNSAGPTVHLLMTDNENPGVLTLDRFAQAVGLTLHELLSLPPGTVPEQG